MWINKLLLDVQIINEDLNNNTKFYRHVNNSKVIV